VKSWTSYSVAILLIAAVLPVYPQVPEWAVSHKHANYPAGEFILGVGYGTGDKADETAKRLAQSDIAAQVRVKVQTEIKNVQQTYELNQNQESYADFKIKSTSVVDEELIGAAIVEMAVDPSTGITYALAALNKEKFSDAIAAELSQRWEQPKELQRQAKEFLRQGKLTEAVENLAEARAAVMELLPKQALHDALSRTPLRVEPSMGPLAITSGIREALSSVRIEKISGDKQKGKIGEKFSLPFVVRATVGEENNVVPVVGDVIVFLNSSGDQLGEGITDAKGVAECSMQARGSIGRQIRARLSQQGLGSEFFSDLNASSVAFDCSVLDADVAFSLKVEVRPSGVNDVLRSVVADAVTNIGYHIVDMSRFMLRVEFQTAPPTTIEGVDGTLYSVSTEITIVLIDKESNRTLGSVIGKSQGVGITQDGALQKSAHSVKLGESELVSLLEKAKN